MDKKSKRRKKEKKRKENIQKILELKERREELEKELSVLDKEKKKRFLIKNLRIFKEACNFVMPYVVVGGVLSGFIAYSGGGWPVINDNIVKYKENDLEYSTGDDLLLESHYRTFNWGDNSLPDSTLIIKTPWKKDNDQYKRFIRTYSIPDNMDESLYEAIIKKDYQKINDLLEYDEEVETRNTEIVNNSKNYEVEAKIYTKNIEDVLNYPESNSRNVFVTVLEAFITALFGSGLAKIRDFDFRDELRRIDNLYMYEIRMIIPVEDELLLVNEEIDRLTKSIGGLRI